MASKIFFQHGSQSDPSKIEVRRFHSLHLPVEPILLQEESPFSGHKALSNHHCDFLAVCCLPALPQLCHPPCFTLRHVPTSGPLHLLFPTAELLLHWILPVVFSSSLFGLLKLDIFRHRPSLSILQKIMFPLLLDKFSLSYSAVCAFKAVSSR